MSQVAVRHPETGGVAVMSQGQFDTLYAARGWEIVTVDPALASVAVGVTISDLSELSSDQLVKVIAVHDAQAPDESRDKLLALKADELRDLAEKAGLATDGTKAEVADRILAYEAQTA